MWNLCPLLNRFRVALTKNTEKTHFIFYLTVDNFSVVHKHYGDNGVSVFFFSTELQVKSDWLQIIKPQKMSSFAGSVSFSWRGEWLLGWTWQIYCCLRTMGKAVCYGHIDKRLAALVTASSLKMFRTEQRCDCHSQHAVTCHSKEFVTQQF